MIDITKYIYITIFFALTAAFFSPLIRGTPYIFNIVGIGVLFVGLAGGVLLYKSSSSKHPLVLSVTGGALMITCAIMIYKVIGIF